MNNSSSKSGAYMNDIAGRPGVNMNNDVGKSGAYMNNNAGKPGVNINNIAGKPGTYDDIINLPHHVSAIHPPMPAIDRAAQFSPFAALTGYDAAVKETARLTDKRTELDEYAKAALDDKLQIIADRIGEHPEIAITYFQPDAKKAGGAYTTTVGCAKKIEEYGRIVVLTDGTKIPIEDIIGIEGLIFGTASNL